MLKVVTWNVNSIKARFERVCAFLERENPDVLCLQELKGITENFPVEAFLSLGYHSAVYGQKTYNGVAILSRKRPQNIVRSFDDGIEDAAARFVGATVQGVRIFSAYIPNGQAVGSEKYTYKLQWLKRLKTFLETHHRPEEPLLVVGDFNVAPEDRDCYDPELWRGKILFSDAEKAALADVCSFGLTDTLRLHHDEAGLYSWWDYRELGFPKNKGMRIDFILATAPLVPRCQGSSIARNERKGEGASDHAPVIAEFT